MDRLRRLFSRVVELGLGPYIVVSKLQKTFLEPFQYRVLFLEGIFYTDSRTSSKFSFVQIISVDICSLKSYFHASHPVLIFPLPLTLGM